MWSAFQNDAPFILGALLDAACAALANEDQVQLSQKPRLVDFVKWASAAETALGWEHESFLNAYLHNRMQKDETVLETDTVASALMDFIQTYPFWEGSAQELLDQIKEFASEKERQSRKWLDSPRSLTNRLRKLEPTLKAPGVEVSFRKPLSGWRRKGVPSEFCISPTITAKPRTKKPPSRHSLNLFAYLIMTKMFQN